jgi:lysozyme family protein
MIPAIAAILAREGGYVDHPADRGGPTKYGITMPTLAVWRGHAVTKEDIRNLTEDEAARIYEQRYLKAGRFDRIADPQLQELVLDCAVHHGVTRAMRWLQQALGVADDGIFGPQTERALARAEKGSLVARLVRRRCLFMAEIVRRDPTQAAFIVGWIDRATSFLET